MYIHCYAIQVSENQARVNVMQITCRYAQHNKKRLHKDFENDPFEVEYSHTIQFNSVVKFKGC